MKYLSLFLITIAMNAAAQSNSFFKPDFKSFRLGVNFSADACYRSLKNNDGSQSSGIVISVRDESPRPGFTTGLNAYLPLNDNIGIESGLQYSLKGYDGKKRDLMYETPEPSGPITAQFIYKYHYLDIPFRMNFTFGKKRIRFCAGAGFALNVFIRETQTSIFEYADGRTERETASTPYEYNRLNISPTLSAGIDCKIGRNMHLRIEPVFRYSILKISKTPVTGYLWNAGINTTYYFGL